MASSLLHRLRRQCSRRRRSASPRPQVATRQVGSSDRPQNDVPVISLPKPAAPPGSWLPLCAAARPRPSPVPSLRLGRGTAGATCRSRAAELVQLSGRCKRALTRSIGKLWRRRRIWGAVMAVSVAVTAAVLGLRIVVPCAQWISSPLVSSAGGKPGWGAPNPEPPSAHLDLAPRPAAVWIGHLGRLSRGASAPEVVRDCLPPSRGRQHGASARQPVPHVPPPAAQAVAEVAVRKRSRAEGRPGSY